MACRERNVVVRQSQNLLFAAQKLLDILRVDCLRLVRHKSRGTLDVINSVPQFDRLYVTILGRR